MCAMRAGKAKGWVAAIARDIDQRCKGAPRRQRLARTPLRAPLISALTASGERVGASPGGMFSLEIRPVPVFGRMVLATFYPNSPVRAPQGTTQNGSKTHAGDRTGR